MSARRSAVLSVPDRDFVAVPLSRAELDWLVGLSAYADTLDHEQLSIDLKARGALAQLDANAKARRKPA